MLKRLVFFSNLKSLLKLNTNWQILQIIIIIFLYFPALDYNMHSVLPRVIFISLLVQIFHKIITCGHQRLHPLFDCLLTIIVNSKYACRQCCLLVESWCKHIFYLCSFTLPKEPVNGGCQQVAPPAGGLLHALVPPICTSEPQPGLLPAGGLQQHHPVSVWWLEQQWDLVSAAAFGAPFWRLKPSPQVTSTWCMPSFVRGTFSTS